MSPRTSTAESPTILAREGEADANAATDVAWSRAVAGQASETILELQRDGRIRWASRGDYGLPREALVDAHWPRCVPFGGELLAARLERVLVHGEVLDWESRERNGERSERVFSHRLSPVRAEGVMIGAVLVRRDISELREMQAQLEVSDRLASLGAVVAGVAHEIATPLTALLANLDLAGGDVRRAWARGGVSRELVEELEDARLAAERLRDVVRELKQFSRAPENGHAVSNVNLVVESTLRLASHSIGHRTRIVRELGAVPPVAVSESRLGQLFLNLIVNAAEALSEEEGAPKVITVATALETSGRVVARVSDTGHGIPAELHDKVFAPFFTTKAAGIGTGLGLSICRRIVASFGGELTFDSRVGVGTEFRVYLPVAST